MSAIFSEHLLPLVDSYKADPESVFKVQRRVHRPQEARQPSSAIRSVS